MWSTIFKHDLLDANIRNFHAAPGRAVQASLAITPEWVGQERHYGLRMELNRAFLYELDQPVPDVIGVSLRARVRFLDGAVPQKYTLFRLGSALTVGLWGGVDGDEQGEVRIAFFLGDRPGFVLGKIPIPIDRSVDYRVDWHVSGQLKVFADSRLVAYHNAVHPGVQFAITAVAFGMAQHAMPPGQGYIITSVSVKCLQQQTMLRHMARVLPAMPIPPKLPLRCTTLATGQVVQLATRLRAFMAQYHASATQPWALGEGGAVAPFTPQANQAHALAMTAGAALGAMMRDRDYSMPERFLDPLGGFLRIVHAALPQEFATLAHDVTQGTRSPDACAVPESSIGAETRAQFAGLVQLMDRTKDLINTIAQGA